jgi:hypothetical protein
VSTSSSKPPIGWIVLGGGAAIGVAGAVVGGLALSDFSAFKANPYDDALGNGAKTKAFVADGMYATALVVAAVGIILLVVNR